MIPGSSQPPTICKFCFTDTQGSTHCWQCGCLVKPTLGDLVPTKPSTPDNDEIAVRLNELMDEQARSRFSNPEPSNVDEEYSETPLIVGLGIIVVGAIFLLNLLLIYLNGIGMGYASEFNRHHTSLEIHDENGVSAEVTYKFYVDGTVISAEGCYWIFCGTESSFNAEPVDELMCIESQFKGADKECAEYFVTDTDTMEWGGIIQILCIFMIIAFLSGYFQDMKEDVEERIFLGLRYMLVSSLVVNVMMIGINIIIDISMVGSINDQIMLSAQLMNQGKAVSATTLPNIIPELVLLYLNYVVFKWIFPDEIPSTTESES